MSEHSNKIQKKGTWYSIRHSLLSPYWTFNILEVGYLIVGFLLASIEYTWNREVLLIAVVFIWVAGEGANNLNLADEELTVEMNSDIQLLVGYAMLGTAVVLGLYLSYMTTYWFLLIVMFGATGAIVYNLELFDGLFHDREHLTGVGNLGLTAAWIPIVGGYLLGAGTGDLVNIIGISIFAIGFTMILCAIDYITEDLKAQKYETFDITYTRDVDAKLERLQRRAALQHPLHTLSLVCICTGLYILLAL